MSRRRDDTYELTGVSRNMYGRTRRGHVYFARQKRGYYIKIGFATNLSRRSLNTWLLEILASHGPVKQAEEAALHTRFKHLCVGGEWFEPAPEIWAVINQIRRADGQEPLP